MTRSELSIIGIILLLLVGIYWGVSKQEARKDRTFTSVEIDEATGCQYLVNRNGGITPRIAADYMHMGCKGVQDNE